MERKVTANQLKKDGWTIQEGYCGIFFIERKGEVKGYIPAIQQVVELRRTHSCSKP